MWNVRFLKRRHWVLCSLLLLVMLFKLIRPWSVAYTEEIYPIIGKTLSAISGIFPFAVGDLFIACSIAWCILYPIYAIFYKKKNKWATWGCVAEYLLWVYVWFYWAWGLNYSQPNIYQRMGMRPAEVSKSTLRAFAYQYVDSINSLSVSEERRAKSVFLEESIDKGYQDIHHRWKDLGINAPFCKHPQAKTMLFSWLSSMAGVTGSMGPFFCEFTLNADLQPHEYPATYAHEYAHFLGIANEGEANFYSYIVCTSSPNKAVRFSGYYLIFFHVLANVYDILGKQEGDALVKRIRPEIIQLARHDRAYWLSKRCKALDAAQDFIFDLYLRGNHVENGRKSYSGVIAMILAFKSNI